MILHWSQIYRVWRRNFIIFKRTWLLSLFWIVLEPLFLLAAIGFGLGAYVKTVGGLAYVDFYFPGLLCTTSMMISFFEGAYGNFSKLNSSRSVGGGAAMGIYSVILISPVTVPELTLGELFWAASKGMLSSIGLLVVGLFFGLGHTPRILVVIPVLFANAWIFSCVGMVVTSYVRNYDQMIFPTSGLIVPMSLFCGTFFPVNELNSILKSVIYVLPLTHSVEIVRKLFVSGFSVDLLINAFVLVVIGILVTRFALRRLAYRLQP
ncbi:MAG: ABC transporter permease [Bdellovibrio sp.]|nr:MAG: ABC transporter permease [Bdellovibrio sp.]